MMEPMMMLLAVSGLGVFMEHTFLKWPTFPQQPHSFPLAGHSDWWWNDSAPQFQQPFGEAPASGPRE